MSNVLKKTISSFLIIAMLLPTVLLSSPKKAEAIPVVDAVNAVFNKLTSFFTGASAASTATNTAISIKNAAIEVGKQLLKVAAKRVLAQMTQATINWINNGFHGKPLFLENPDSFFKNIAKTQVKSLVDMIGYDTFRFPFGRQTALNVIDSYKSQFATNAQYSLSKVINDPDLLVQYRNDFNYGGWNGFLINTQYPQNNYLGFNMLVQQNLASRLEGTLQSPAQKVQNALQQGMGFLSPQICPSNPHYNKNIDPDNLPDFDYAKYEREHPSTDLTGAAYDRWIQDRNIAESAYYDTTFCPGGLVSTTPGAVVANQIFTATNTPFLTTALDGALGNSLAAIFDALINKLIGDGLTSLKTSVSGNQEADNWSYQGNTLGGGTTSTNNNTWGWDDASTTGNTPLTAEPQTVNLDGINKTSITTIKGGAQPYEIKAEPNEAIAIVTLAGNGLIVSSVAKGETSVTIADSSSPAKNFTVTIKVTGPEDLSFSPESVTLTKDEKASITVSGGAKPYFVESIADESIADITPQPATGNCTYSGSLVTLQVITQTATPQTTIPGLTEQQCTSRGSDWKWTQTSSAQSGSKQIAASTLEIIGKSGGQTIVVIKDSSYPPKLATITVSVKGKCEINGVLYDNQTESECSEQNGTFFR